ncbi:MAG TPA: amidase [Alicyclobacillus sp.]|nr:amidase [Alicyclobacillus sp.]
MLVGKTNHEHFLQWDLLTLSAAIKRKELSPVEVTQQLLQRIDAINAKLNAYITVFYEDALQAAVQTEKEMAVGHWKGPLHGIPIALKDVIYTKNARTTMGSEIYKDFVPDYDAGVVEKLKQAGAIIIGKLNTHQFAYGSTGDRSYFGAVKNPYDLTKITGGSSSGSGAAVAAALCYGALGTDTGGSIRIPATCCGIVGMKPTFGRVSKYGVYPLSWTMDHVGPMTRTVLDNAVLLNVLSGYDERDPYSERTKDEDFTRLIGQSIQGTVIGVPSSYYYDNLDPEVDTKVRNAVEIFKSLGARVRVIDVTNLETIFMAQRLTLSSEAFAVHKDTLEKFPEQYDREVKERLLRAERIKAHEYVLAQQQRHKAKHAFLRALSDVDVIVTPTLPILPPNIEQREIKMKDNTEPVLSTLVRLTSPTNFNGFPSLSIPCGFSESGLPIGLQLIGRPWDEANLYRFAYAFEREVSLPNLI